MRHVTAGRAAPAPAARVPAPPRRGRAAGLSLIEVMVVVAILGLLLAAGAPALADYVANSRLREGGHLLLGEALMAQSEAVKRNVSTRLSTSGDEVQVLELTDPANPVLLRSRKLTSPVSMQTVSVTFGSDGRPAPFGTSASINLSLAGSTCSADIRCPGLRIDAGGAVRLCPNQLVSCS